MYTQCPECLTIFEIDENTLQAALGIVRCGHCSQRFDALLSLNDSLPSAPDTTLATPDPAPRLPTLTKAVAVDADAGATHEEPDPSSGTEMPPDALPTPSNEDFWLANLNTRHTDALLAAAAGIPHVATPDAEDWRLTLESPTQARFAELDIIPLTPDELASIEAESHVVPSEPELPVPVESDSTLAPPAMEPETGAAEDVVPELPGDAPYYSAEPAWLVDDAGYKNPIEAGHALDEPGLPVRPGDEVPLADSPDVESEAEIPPVVPTDDAVIASNDSSESMDGAVDLKDGGGTVPDSATEPGPDAMTYVRPRPRWFSRVNVPWTLGCLVLALVLVAQLAWAKRVALFENPQSRPWLVHLCHHLPCRLPPIRDIAKLELLSRDIRPDPNAPGALTITATLRNNAAFRQPWPIVTVEINDIDGNRVAMRRFRPERYMPDPARRAAGIAAGATAAVAFEVADPGKRAVAFQFSFE